MTDEEKAIVSKRERATWSGILGLLFLVSTWLDADCARPTWATWTVGLLVSGWLAWFVWRWSGDPDERTLGVIAPSSMLLLVAIGMLILFVARR